jgi:NADH-quinone oxidoreductase subunit J
MEVVVFVIGAVMVLGGALGVVLRAKPVHCALSLVLTLFGIAVLFIAQDANFLAAVQVIVYAGAIVVLFLFVIMLLGVDEHEELDEPLPFQRWIAGAAGVGALALIGVLLGRGIDTDVAHQARGALGTPGDNVHNIGVSLFSDYLWAFEITSVLLVIAVVGAVVLVRRRGAGAPPAAADAAGQAEAGREMDPVGPDGHR